MFWLPKIVVNAVDWRLPLAESTATTIVATLFPASAEVPRAALRQAVASDPAWALWLACNFPRDRIPTGIDELVGWFLDEGRACLAWTVEETEALAPPRWNPGAWFELSQRSRRAARQAALALENSPQAPVGELIALLHASHDLLSLCGPTGDEGGREIPNCLPGWLVAAIEQVGLTDSGNAFYQSLRQAIQASHVSETGLNEPPGGAAAAPAHSATTTFAGLLPQLTQRMARLAELENQFGAALESAKLAAMRELAYGASHEINNPLANISTRAQTLLVDETDPERRRKLATINAQAFRAHEMISDIMLFAKPPQLDPTLVDLAALTNEILAELADDAAEQGTELRSDLGVEPLAVQADREHLAVALKALVRNSLEAIGLGGHIDVRLRPLAAESAHAARVEIEIQDTGPGVPAAVRDSMFNPFYSGREAGRGLGLGLSKCWRIITLHGGTIVLDESHTAGARFVIRLPVGATQTVSPEFAAHG